MHPSAGGPPVVADRFCRQLQKLGNQCEIISTDSYAPSDDESWIADYEANYRLTILEGKGPQGFGYAPDLRRVLIERLPDVDIVHIHNLWSYFNIMGSRLCRKFNVPFVVSTHGMLDPNSLARKSWKKFLYSRMVEWRQLRNASGMIFTHQEELELASKQCEGLPPGFVVPLASDTPPSEDRSELAQEFLSKYPKFANKKLVLFLGRIHSKKGLDILIPAFAKVSQQINDVELLFVGPVEASYRRELEAMAQNCGAQDKCHFLGSFQGDLKWSVLAAADVFALISYQENFAIALVEALRVGTPAVISRRINIWKDLEKNETVLISELDEIAAAESLGRLLESDNLRRRFGGNGKEFAASEFSWQRTAELLANSYRKLIRFTNVDS